MVEYELRHNDKDNDSWITEVYRSYNRITYNTVLKNAFIMLKDKNMPDGKYIITCFRGPKSKLYDGETYMDYCVGYITIEYIGGGIGILNKNFELEGHH